MIGPTPAETVERLVEAFHRRDVDAALALYEPDGILVTTPGTIASGQAALRQAIEDLVALKPTLTTESYEVLVGGDTALYCSVWHLIGTAPDGSEVRLGGRSTDVLRRTSEGTWRIAIDNPWGTVHLPA